jgi:hypothetical protein
LEQETIKTDHDPLLPQSRTSPCRGGRRGSLSALMPSILAGVFQGTLRNVRNDMLADVSGVEIDLPICVLYIPMDMFEKGE